MSKKDESKGRRDFQGRDPIIDAIHSRTPFPCGDYVRAQKIVVLYPSLKDRNRFFLSDSGDGSEDVKKINSEILALSRPLSESLGFFARKKLSSSYSACMTRLRAASKKARSIETKDYGASARAKFETLSTHLKSKGFEEEKKSAGEQSFDKNGSKTLIMDGEDEDETRIRFRWEQFSNNHAVQIIEDVPANENGSGYTDAVTKSFGNLYRDAFTSLSDYMDGGSSSTKTCDCPSSRLCQSAGRCEVRGQFRTTLEDSVCYCGPAGSGKHADNLPIGGILCVADYWIIPIDAFIDEYSSDLDKNTYRDVLSGAQDLKRNAEKGNADSAPLSDASLSTLKSVLVRAREWLNIKSDPKSASGEDFVFSFINDQRAILISDLRPDRNVDRDRVFADEGSRTIVVDLGMHTEERGRVLQRLMDISTYRHLGLRGFTYAETGVDTITEIGATLNRISNSRRTRPQTKLRILQDLSHALDSLNSFFTYGISGRWESVDRYRRGVDDNLGLLRESRIPGHQTLAGYLERYKWAARQVEVLAARYRDVRRRLDEAVNLVKIEFEKQQALILLILTVIAVFIGFIEITGFGNLLFNADGTFNFSGGSGELLE